MQPRYIVYMILIILGFLMFTPKCSRADDLYIHTGAAFGCGGSYPVLGIGLRNWVAERDFFNSMAFGLGYLFQSVELATNLDSFNYSGNHEPKDRRLFLGLARSMDIIDAGWLEIAIGIDAPFGHMAALEPYASVNLTFPLALDL